MRDLKHEKQVIKHNIDEFKEDPELLKDVMFEFITRVKQCIEANGDHFEYKWWGKLPLSQKLDPFSRTRHYKAI